MSGFLGVIGSLIVLITCWVIKNDNFFQNKGYQYFFQRNHRSVKQFGTRSERPKRLDGPYLSRNCLERS